jgi:hypothetical protein
MKLPILLAAVAVAATPFAASAHHGWSGQDNAKVTSLTGTIEAVRYRNPHGEIDIASGNQKWTVTLAPLQRMNSRGLSEALLKPGTQVSVTGHRNLNMSRYEIKANQIAMGGKTTNLR